MREFQVLDAAAIALRAFARAVKCNSITLTVRADGRVEIRAERAGFTQWILRADLDPDSSDPMPSRAMAIQAARAVNDKLLREDTRP